MKSTSLTIAENKPNLDKKSLDLATRGNSKDEIVFSEESSSMINENSDEVDLFSKNYDQSYKLKLSNK